MRATRLLKPALLALLVVAGPAQAAKPDEATIKAMTAVWTAHHKALDAHDLNGVMATFADSDDVMLMGTGPGEHWVGREELQEAFAGFMEAFDAFTMEASCVDGEASTDGPVLWFTAVCNFSDARGGEARAFTLNLSGVLVRSDDVWRFHTMHFSNLGAGDSK